MVTQVLHIKDPVHYLVHCGKFMQEFLFFHQLTMNDACMKFKADFMPVNVVLLS